MFYHRAASQRGWKIEFQPDSRRCGKGRESYLGLVTTCYYRALGSERQITVFLKESLFNLFIYLLFPNLLQLSGRLGVKLRLSVPPVNKLLISKRLRSCGYCLAGVFTADSAEGECVSVRTPGRGWGFHLACHPP